MKLLQFILIVLIIYVVIRLVWRAYGKQILSWMGRKAMQKVQKSFEQRMGGQPGFGQRTDSTETRREKSNAKKHTFREKKKVGEYVDFEEID